MLELIYFVVTILVLPAVLLRHCWDELRKSSEYSGSPWQSRFLVRGVAKAAVATALVLVYAGLAAHYSGLPRTEAIVAIGGIYFVFSIVDYLYRISRGRISGAVAGWEDLVKDHWRGLLWTAITLSGLYFGRHVILMVFVVVTGSLLFVVVEGIPAAYGWVIGSFKPYGLWGLAIGFPSILVLWLAWYAHDQGVRITELTTLKEAEEKEIARLKAGYQALIDEIRSNRRDSKALEGLREIIEFLQIWEVGGRPERFDEVTPWAAKIAQFKASRRRTEGESK